MKNKLLLAALIILLAWAFLCINWACNSTKKNTSLNKQIEKTESEYKIDSAGKSSESVVKDSTGKKQWNSETVIEFDSGSVLRILPNYLDDGSAIIRVLPTPESAYLEFKGVRKITHRTSGTDTSAKKEIAAKSVESDLKKDGKQNTFTKKIEKKKYKASKRMPIGLIIAGVVGVIVCFFLFLIYKRSKSIEPEW